MRYSRDGKWTPVPITQRLRSAGWGLTIPLLFNLLPFAIVSPLIKGFFFVFPQLRGKPNPEWEPWIWIFVAASVVGNILIQELAIINGDTADLGEMVSERLSALEDRVERQDP